jgi:hypothetical protein
MYKLSLNEALDRYMYDFECIQHNRTSPRGDCCNDWCLFIAYGGNDAEAKAAFQEYTEGFLEWWAKKRGLTRM